MNKKQYISKLGAFGFLMISLLFSCNNEKEAEKDIVIPPFELQIDSTNASEFAKSFVQDIYNSDTISARSKVCIEYDGDPLCIDELLAIDNVFSELDLFTQLNKQVMLGADLRYRNFQMYFNHGIVWLGLFTAPKEINYYRLNIVVVNNKIVISDYRSFMRGASCNEMMDELVNLVCVKGSLNIRELKDGVLLMDSTVNAFNNLDSEKAMVYYSKIDFALRESMIIMATKYNMDFHSSSEIRVSALRKSKHSMGKGKFTPWIWFSHFYINMEIGKYSKVRDALPGLRFAVGEDPILTYLEATTYFEEFNYDKALELYNDALIAEPTIPNVHFAKVICLIEMKEYTQAVESLLVMEDYFEVVNINWDKEFMAYPEFLISDEYSKWLERVGAIEEL